MHRMISSEPERFADSYFDMSAAEGGPGLLAHCTMAFIRQLQEFLAWTMERVNAEE